MSVVTTSRGRDIAMPARSARARALPRMSGYDCPGLATTGSTKWIYCYYSHGQAALQPASSRCHTANLPRAVTQLLPVSSHNHRVRACPLCQYPAAGLVRCCAHMGELVVTLPLMAPHPCGPCRLMDVHACTIASARITPRSRRPHLAKARSR